MIIDCHGHYTTAPSALQEYRDAQLACLEGPSTIAPATLAITDDQVREGIEATQLRMLRERGGDMMILSPKASAMEHHVADQATAIAWARTSNDLVHRVVGLFPDSFAGVCQLPQTPSRELDDSVLELRRCVEELGFIGCNVNPDPSGGFWTSPPVTDPYWFPLYDTMVELDVPGMVHVSASCNPSFPTLGAHYLNADTSVFMQLLEGDLFSRFPTLRLVIPHGGGAVPYHWGRYRALAERLGRPPLAEHLMRNVSFDTCVYHQAGVDLLLKVVDVDSVLFASEMFGAVRGIDPDTGYAWDDTKRYVDASGLDAEQLHRVYEANARRVYPRLDAMLASRSR